MILWDGGNNDFSFYKPDLQITVVDPHRPGHELTYYPGEISLRLADVVVINKMDSADAAGIQTVRRNIAAVQSRVPRWSMPPPPWTWTIHRSSRAKGCWRSRMDRPSPMVR